MTDPAAYDDPRKALAAGRDLQAAGRAEEAERLYRRALELDPDSPETLFSYGVFRRESGDAQAAAEILDRVVAIVPDAANAWLELTRAHHDLGRWDQCVAAAERTLALDTNCAEAELMRAVGLFAQHHVAAATDSIARVAAALPEDAGVQLFHARCLLAGKRYDEALAPAGRAARLAPDTAEAHYLLGASLKRVGRNEAAESALQRCLQIAPDLPDALNDLADIHIARGDTQAALACLRKSHAASPYNLDAISGLCFYTAFDPHSDAADLFAINRDWSERLGVVAGGDALPTPARHGTDTRVRVAYLAYDLFDHVTSWFLEPVLARHDRGRFHVTGYFGNEKTDEVTNRLGSYTDSWQSIAADTIAETAERIRRDNIDILVLASFFRGKDRRIFAHRCAPLQVGYHNRVASTGLDTADYIITEAVSDPPGRVERHYTEALVRITNHNVYLPPADAPGPLAPPCLSNGYVTFGSFNNLAKIGDNVIATWSAILHGVPHSRLILRSSVHFDNATTRSYFQQRFADHGIDSQRLEFQGLKALRKDHLAGMREADITLDPFPCNGGTTSCEALWMGLPMITMETDSYMGRQGASYLIKLGLADLIAYNAPEYTQKAIQLANDRRRIAALRESLRRDVESKIFDYNQHILELETAYCHMVDRLRAGKPPKAFNVRDNSVFDPPN